MPKDALTAEIRAAAASMVTAVAAAENEAAAENALMDAQDRGSRLLRELSLMQGLRGLGDTAIPASRQYRSSPSKLSSGSDC